MKKFITFSIAAMLLLVLPVGVIPALAQETEQKAQQAEDKAQKIEEAAEAEDEEEPVDPVKESVNQALGQFYMALNALFKGEVEPMKKVWSHSADVTYMPPDGKYLIGWDETLKSWEQQASLNLGGVIKPVDLHYNIGETIAVVHNYELGENFTDGKPQTVKIRATNLFRKENGEWKMIGHHVDLLPYLIKEEKE